MHKSRLAGLIIDCRTDDLDRASRFWADALGMSRLPLPGKEGANYVKLDDPELDLHVEVQRVAHESRVHLDIETDDIEAEVKRLEALGATRVAQVESWWVMAAPTGQRFCVVRVESPRFAATAKRWD